MESQYQAIFDGFNEKLQLLLLKYKQLEQEHKDVLTELKRKNEEIKSAHHEILELRSDYDNLKRARILALTERDKKESCRQLSKLVRDIDTCLELLNE